MKTRLLALLLALALPGCSESTARDFFTPPLDSAMTWPVNPNEQEL